MSVVLGGLSEWAPRQTAQVGICRLPPSALRPPPASASAALSSNHAPHCVNASPSTPSGYSCLLAMFHLLALWQERTSKDCPAESSSRPALSPSGAVSCMRSCSSHHPSDVLVHLLVSSQLRRSLQRPACTSSTKPLQKSPITSNVATCGLRAPATVNGCAAKPTCTSLWPMLTNFERR